MLYNGIREKDNIKHNSKDAELNENSSTTPEYELYYYFKKITEDTKKVNIIGAAGLGKSLLTYILAKIIAEETENNIYYVDTENKFSKRRFATVSHYNTRFIPPEKKRSYEKLFKITSAESLEKQEMLISMAFGARRCLDPKEKVGAIIIDSISKYARNCNGADLSWVKSSEKMLDYYENNVLPLLLFQQKKDCYLIFTHQVSYNPEKGNKMVLGQIYEDKGFSQIELTTEVEARKIFYQMRFSSKKFEYSRNFEINRNGFEFY